MHIWLIFMCLLNEVISAPAADTYKNRYCTDPRTMRRHPAFSEWADAYSCTKHRCQPGGTNLAIYTVGCKRVEAPESAIECEEVVEDTNIQFPYCCTRLRCLVVVRGEVWTRVLGQPWETLPAAPWSHMYKMKKPPPSGTAYLPKGGEKGPVYELCESEVEHHDETLNIKKTNTNPADCNEVEPRAAPTPDIVIALSTNSDLKNLKKSKKQRRTRSRHTASYSDDEQHNQPGKGPMDIEDTALSTEKDGSFYQPDFPPQDPDKKDEKPSNIHVLVDAIGTRMRDIEGVVQKMTEKVHKNKPREPDLGSGEKITRFSVKSRNSRYLSEGTEQPFAEDNNMNGYFNDPSNNVMRRANPPKEPAQTYMAPIDTRRKEPAHIIISDSSDETEKKKKKKHHKKRRGKSRSHKKHHKDDKKKKHRMNSAEVDQNIISFEDSNV